MRVFLTGASGFVGAAIIRELRTAGHTVLGLARSDEAAAGVAALGAEVHRGELTDHESLLAGVRAADGVIHTAFHAGRDFANFARSIETDRSAIVAMVGALEGSNRPFVSTSGTMLLPGGKVSTEKDVALSEQVPRAGAEAVMVAGAGRGVRTSFVRLSPSVHGRADDGVWKAGFAAALVALARRKGFVGYAGAGENRWPAVHRDDAARLFRLALEKGAPGSAFHGVAEEGVSTREIAEAIGAGLGLPARSVAADDAGYFEWFLPMAGADKPSSSAITREVLGWRPERSGLLDDMRAHAFG